MPEFVPFGSHEYWWFLLALGLGRSMDFFSTWLATPNLVLEGNPIAKWLGWKFGIPLNLAICVGFARFPLPALVITTTSFLVAARNLQGAWLMRVMGEHVYRAWMSARMTETPLSLYLLCLVLQCLLLGAVGVTLVWFEGESFFSLGIGMGVIAYASAVLIFSLLSLRRRRRG